MTHQPPTPGIFVDITISETMFVVTVEHNLKWVCGDMNSVIALVNAMLKGALRPEAAVKNLAAGPAAR